MVLAKAQAQVTDEILRCGSSSVGEWVAFFGHWQGRRGGQFSHALLLPKGVVLLDQFLTDRDFVHTVFGERNTHRIPNAVFKQRADANGGLDTTVLPFPGFRDTE